MTPEQFEACLLSIGWSNSFVADRLGVAEVTLRRWGSGAYPVPAGVAEWLERLAAAHDANPVPVVAKQKPGPKPDPAGVAERKLAREKLAAKKRKRKRKVKAKSRPRLFRIGDRVGSERRVG